MENHQTNSHEEQDPKQITVPPVERQKYTPEELTDAEEILGPEAPTALKSIHKLTGFKLTVKRPD